VIFPYTEIIKLNTKSTVNMACPSALQGLRILITRPPEQAAAWIDYFQALGAETFLCPLISIQAERDSPALHQALNVLDQYDYLVVSSSNAVSVFLKALQSASKDPFVCLAHLTLAAVGPQTASALSAATGQVVLFPEVYQAEGLSQMLIQKGLQGQRLLYLRAQGAREVLASQLRETGAVVDEVVLYQTQAPEPASLLPLFYWLENSQLDILTFASASAVDHFAQAVPKALWQQVSDRVQIAALGPITAQRVAEKLGKKAILAPEASLESLALAIQSAMQATHPLPPSEVRA